MSKTITKTSLNCSGGEKEELTCGFWIFKGRFVQKFANQTAYVVIYGLVGCVFAMSYAYFNGIITTIEKRFKIPSRNMGIISAGYDISQILSSVVLSYFAGRSHRPRWIAFGILTIVGFCLLNALPHFWYGPGEEALALTAELTADPPNANATFELWQQQSKGLCQTTGHAGCVLDEGNFAPQVVLFLAQLMAGVGGTLYYALGISYMDDNTKRSKTPVLLSVSYFLRLLGPAIGYALASLCLNVYIAPQLRPVINQKDPRWLGAWWLGWLVLGVLLLFCAIIFAMFPRTLPRAVARRQLEEKRRTESLRLAETFEPSAQLEQPAAMAPKASLKDMLVTYKRLAKNKTLMYNNCSSVFYMFGFTPYWIFTPKYIEIQYRQSAATSNLITGTVALAFSAVGVLFSGIVISKFKPRARYMAAWNVIVGLLSVAGTLAYMFIGCPDNEASIVLNMHDSSSGNTETCNSACNCDYVSYAPVCGADSMTYISACHAGCKQQHIGPNGKEIFYDCSCIPSGNTTAFDDRQAAAGACPVDCFAQFVVFLAVMCGLQFLGAAGRTSNFLVSVRCVPEADKTASMGLGMMLLSLLAFIPSPIFFGWFIDRLCLVWGKTCTHRGNCWLYDAASLRYNLNFTAAMLIAIGTLFDGVVWYYVKDMQIFDANVEDTENAAVSTQFD